MTFLIPIWTLSLSILMIFWYSQKTLESHFKHLHTFKQIIIQNGLVISKPKISLFQTNIRFLGHNISQGSIEPIQRVLEFTKKIP